MHRSTLMILFIALLALLLSGCGVAVAAAPTETATPPASPTPMATATQTPTPAPTHTPTAVPTLTYPLLFETISPAVAFIETPGGSGSGALLEDGYLVTNAHVVWPYETVRVVFPDGSEHIDVPVVNWDLMADLALLGPVETDLLPLALADGEDLPIGSDLFLIGYPGEVDTYPQPTFTTGTLSRLREWTPQALTYFQTDALIAEGQSGGVLADRMGRVIGISGLSYTEADFALVLSAADIQPRLEALRTGQDMSGLGSERRLLANDGALRHEVTLAGERDVAIYVLDEPAGTDIELGISSDTEAAVIMLDGLGTWMTGGTTDMEAPPVTTVWEQPHIVLAAQGDDAPAPMTITSSHILRPYHDPDDGQTISQGQTVAGSLDFAGDIDTFILDLAADEVISLTVRSMMIDAFISVDFPEAADEQVVMDDDSGRGIPQTDAHLVYQPPHAGRYYLVVEDSWGYNTGGYVLTVQAAPADAEPEIVPEVTPMPTLEPSETPPVEMVRYESSQQPFSFEYPADWTEQSLNTEPSDYGQAVSYAHGTSALFISEEDIVAQGFGEMTLDEYVEMVLYIAEQDPSQPQLIASERRETAQGLPVHILEFASGPGGQFRVIRLIYLHEGAIGFNIAYAAPQAEYETLEAIIQHSFSSFQVEGLLLLDELVEVE